MKILLIIVFLLACFRISEAQNLVPDSSFEYNKFIPVDYSGIDVSTSWSSPSRGTTDLFCKCGKKQEKISRVNVPKNSMGVQEALTGKCYAGVFAVSHGYYREYLQTGLSSPLERNKEYELSLYVSLSDYSPLAVDQIGICFLNNKVKYEHSGTITDLRPLYINLEEEVGMDVNEWHELTLRYKAKGGENTLLIGSFGIKRLWKTGNTVPQEISSPIYKKMQRDAYYYFDNVSLHEFKTPPLDTAQVPENPYFANMKADTVETEIVLPDTINTITSGEVLVFNKVLFQTGAAILSPVSFPELNIVAAYLKADQNLKIEIYGHTDNVGDEKKNKELSYDRAKAVADYLIFRGVKNANVFYEGFGSLKPIEANDTEEGKKSNRRVEFILKKNN
ncbi:MAG: OmpA family protein [Bacteroidetes bacterium]|nr:OmpA family protein [Bacteroidota bacterium]